MGELAIRVLTDDRSKVPTLVQEALSRPLKEMAEEAQRNAEADAPVSDRRSKPGKPKYALSFGNTQGSLKTIGALMLPGFPQGARIRVRPAGTYNFAPHAPFVEWPTGEHGPRGRSYKITAKRKEGKLWIPLHTFAGAPPDPRNPKVQIGAAGGLYYVTEEVDHPGSEGKYILTNAAVAAMDRDAEKFRKGLRDAAEDLNLEVEESSGSKQVENAAELR